MSGIPIMQSADDELQALALEGLNSGAPIEAGPGYWEEKHRRLDERLNKTRNRPSDNAPPASA